MSDGAQGEMADLAGEVVKKLEKLHAEDVYPLSIAHCKARLGLKQKGARLVYVLTFASKPKKDNDESEIRAPRAQTARVSEDTHNACLVLVAR